MYGCSHCTLMYPNWKDWYRLNCLHANIMPFNRSWHLKRMVNISIFLTAMINKHLYSILVSDLNYDYILKRHNSTKPSKLTTVQTTFWFSLRNTVEYSEEGCFFLENAVSVDKEHFQKHLPDQKVNMAENIEKLGRVNCCTLILLLHKISLGKTWKLLFISNG